MSKAAGFDIEIPYVAHLGIRHVDMPFTPERMWRLLRA